MLIQKPLTEEQWEIIYSLLENGIIISEYNTPKEEKEVRKEKKIKVVHKEYFGDSSYSFGQLYPQGIVSVYEGTKLIRPKFNANIFCRFEKSEEGKPIRIYSPLELNNEQIGFQERKFEITEEGLLEAYEHYYQSNYPSLTSAMQTLEEEKADGAKVVTTLTDLVMKTIQENSLPFQPRINAHGVLNLVDPIYLQRQHEYEKRWMREIFGKPKC